MTYRWTLGLAFPNQVNLVSVWVVFKCDLFAFTAKIQK
jgi:hypothetical protein